jgi:hypothetical protein
VNTYLETTEPSVLKLFVDAQGSYMFCIETNAPEEVRTPELLSTDSLTLSTKIRQEKAMFPSQNVLVLVRNITTAPSTFTNSNEYELL